MMLLGKKGMDVQAPIFIRIYKEESELEVWKLRDDGRYYHYKTYPICTWSGDARAQAEGRRQAGAGRVLHDHARADEPQFAALSGVQPRLSQRLRQGAAGAPATR